MIQKLSILKLALVLAVISNVFADDTAYFKHDHDDGKKCVSALTTTPTQNNGSSKIPDINDIISSYMQAENLTADNEHIVEITKLINMIFKKFPDMDGKDNADIIDAVNKVLELIDVSRMHENDMSIAIKTMINVDKTDRNDFVNRVKLFLTYFPSIKKEDERGLVIEALVNVDKNDIDDFANLVKLFRANFPDMEEEDGRPYFINSCVIKALSMVDKADIDEFTNQAKQFLASFDDASGWGKANIIWSISELDRGDRGDVLDKTKLLMKGYICDWHIYDTINSLGKVGKADRDDVFARTKSIASTLGNSDLFCFIDAIKAVDKADRDDAINLVENLIKERMPGLMGVSTMGVLIKQVAKINKADRQDIIDKVKPLITRFMRAEYIGTTIQAVASIDKQHRASFVNLASTDIAEFTNFDRGDRTYAIKLLALLPEKDRNLDNFKAIAILLKSMIVSTENEVVDVISNTVPEVDRMKVINRIQNSISGEEDTDYY